MLNVALVFGGRSVEHDVSVNSAKNISSNADIAKFNILPFGISKKGKWYLLDEVNSDIEKGIPLTLTLDASAPVFHAADKALNREPASPLPDLHTRPEEPGPHHLDEVRRPADILRRG